MAVAIAARLGATVGPAGVPYDRFRTAVDPHVPAGELRSLLERLSEPLARGGTVADDATAIGVGPGGVSGYVNQTVPVALAAWLRHPADARAAVTAVVLLGGDTDTTGAIVGALVGATAGSTAVPADWLGGIVEWPRSVSWVRRLGERLASGGETLPLFWPALVVRNAVFAVTVVGHGVRRLLPPW